MYHIPRRIAQHFPKSVFTALKKLDLSNNRGLQHYSASLKYWVFIPNLQSLSIGGFDTRRLQTAYEPLQLGLLFTHCQIKSLAVHNCSLSTKSLCSLLDADFATHLKSLDVSANPIESDIWTAFQHANHQMRLDRLDISGIGFSASSLHALLANKRLEKLNELEINHFDLAHGHAEVLGESRYWAQAKEFRAYASSLQDESLELLTLTTGSRQLKLLDLAENYLHIDGVSHLCDAPWSRSLNWLSLSGNYLDDDAVNLFADSGHFPELRTLHLAHPKRLEGHHEYVITGNSVAALANARHLANLRVLTVNGAMIGRDGVDAALHSPHWKLSGLGIAGCELTVTTVNLMARSPRLARLTWLDLSMNRFLVGDSLLPLAESPYLSRLCELDIRGCGASDRVREILRERLGPRLSD